VIDFLKANEKITAALLVKLECDIAEVIRTKQPESSANVPEVSAEETNGTTKGSTSHSKLPPPGTEWEVLNLYQSIVHEERQQREKEMTANRKAKFKEMLDQQIRDAQAMKAQMDQQDKTFHQFIVASIPTFADSQYELSLL
jgi:hypothetical protein